jgi:hypothetical protein
MSFVVLRLTRCATTAERTPSGKILKAGLRKVAAVEWARRTGASQTPKFKL